MTIELNEEQHELLKKDGTLTVNLDDDHCIYFEINEDDLRFEYMEYLSGPRKDRFCVDLHDVSRLKAQRPSDPSYYHNDPLCPNCRTYMIYKFEFCPKCGQKLDWSEE